MSFERACSTDEVSTDEALAVTLGDVEVAVAKHVDDDGTAEFFALQNVCSHAEVELSEGEVADCTIECWLHGSMFDLRTGKPTGLPATRPVPTFPVTVEGDDVLVQMES